MDLAVIKLIADVGDINLLLSIKEEGDIEKKDLGRCAYCNRPNIEVFSNGTKRIECPVLCQEIDHPQVLFCFFPPVPVLQVNFFPPVPIIK